MSRWRLCATSGFGDEILSAEASQERECLVPVSSVQIASPRVVSRQQGILHSRDPLSCSLVFASEIFVCKGFARA